MKVSSFADMRQTWGVLAMNMEPILGDVAHAGEAHAQFKALVEEMRLLIERVEVQRSGIRDLAMQRQALVKRGRKLRNVLAAALQSHFGLESPELIRFGVKPRAEEIRRTRPSKAAKQALEAAPQVDSIAKASTS